MSGQNPHIPKFIKDAPWYAASGDDGTNDDYLAHHRSGKEFQKNSEPRIGSGIRDDFVRDPNKEPTHSVNTARRRLRKAKCTTCGSMTHDKSQCLEKPQKKRIDRENLELDDAGKGRRNESLDYDGKRDRWYGYDVNEYDGYVKKWEAKKPEVADTRDFDTDEEIELKELGLCDEEDLKELKSLKKKSNNLEPGEVEKVVRLREDRAVYLQDVRSESINYDPKSRKVRDKTVMDDTKNQFVKHLTGDAEEFEASKQFAWDDTKRGVDVDNYVSNPTLADRKMRTQSKEKELKSSSLKKKLLGVYGDKTISGDSSSEQRNAVTIDDSTSHCDDNDDDDVKRSKYAEDVYINNHTSVWGSFYEKNEQGGSWGYKCCKSTVKDSLCK